MDRALHGNWYNKKLPCKSGRNQNNLQVPRFKESGAHKLQTIALLPLKSGYFKDIDSISCCKVILLFKARLMSSLLKTCRPVD